MTIEHIRKASKRLQRLLPAFVEQHSQPYSLTAVQHLVSQMNGFANFELASQALGRNEEESQDALASFYRYPWFEVDPHAVISAVEGGAERVELTVLPFSEAEAWLDRRLATSKFADSITMIVAAGTQGADFIYRLFDSLDGSGSIADHLRRTRMDVGISQLSHRLGMAMNWLHGWNANDVAAVLEAMVRPVTSREQFAVCSRLVRLSVAAEDEQVSNADREITVAALNSKVQSILCAGPNLESEDSDLYYNFGESFFNAAQAIVKQHHSEDELRRLARPLECLLARLSAQEATERSSRDSDQLRLNQLGLNLINVDMGGKRLDHLVAAAVVAKAAATPPDDWLPSITPSKYEVALVVR